EDSEALRARRRVPDRREQGVAGERERPRDDRRRRDHGVRGAEGGRRAGTRRAALRETGLLVVAEDHWSEGGLGDAVLDALAESGELLGRVVKLAVREMPGSGTPGELRDRAGISAAGIAEAVRRELTP